MHIDWSKASAPHCLFHIEFRGLGCAELPFGSVHHKESLKRHSRIADVLSKKYCNPSQKNDCQFKVVIKCAPTAD